MENEKKSWNNLKMNSIHTLFNNLSSEDFIKLNHLKNKNIQKYFFQKLHSTIYKYNI